MAVERVDPGADATDEEVAAAATANIKLFELVGRTAEADLHYGRARFIVMGVLALVAALSSAALLLSARGDELWAAVASAVTVIATLAVAGFINPLQTVERDIIIRRWSDVIVSGWGADMGGDEVEPDFATQRASERFAVLAAAYTTITSKTFDTLAAITGTKPAEEEAEAAEEVTVTPPGSQTSAQGDTLDPAVTIEAAGGSGEYTFAAVGLPPDLTLGAASGKITGTVKSDAEVKDWVVEVTATEVLEDGAAETPTSGSDKFVWTVTAPAT